MRVCDFQRFVVLGAGLCCGLSVGCGDSSPPSSPTAAKTEPVASPAIPAVGQASETTSAPAESSTDAEPPAGAAPVKLGGRTSASGSGAGSKPQRSVEQQYDGVKSALKTVQVLIGLWHGIAQKSTGGAQGYEELNWVWDVKTDKAQPAFVMKTDRNPHYKSARLTFLLDEQQYQLTVEDNDGRRRELRGVFTEEPQDKPGEDKKQTPQRTYKLQLTESGDEKDCWQVVLNQQDNNRYLLEMSRLRGKTFVRFDTISSQREGTSFALNDSDYKDRTCVISQGLGTISVSHKGKTYWVCCSGCKAAFEEDPEKWIAKFEAMQEKK